VFKRLFYTEIYAPSLHFLSQFLSIIRLPKCTPCFRCSTYAEYEAVSEVAAVTNDTVFASNDLLLPPECELHACNPGPMSSC